jgi:DNA-binding NtrC family response regulator
MTVATLSEEVLKILTATDPEAGLQLVRRHHPQIVLVDLMMPGASGLEILERILDIDPGIEVILITGHYSTESAVAAIQKGASDYLQKPLATGLLRQRIGKLAEEARRRRRATIGHIHPDGDLVPLEELRRNQLLRALECTGGNKALAARELGINRTTIYRFLKKSRTI